MGRIAASCTTLETALRQPSLKWQYTEKKIFGLDPQLDGNQTELIHVKSVLFPLVVNSLNLFSVSP